MFRLTALCAGLLLSANALALSLADLSQNDASSGLKDALTQGAQIAVRQLGQPGGFNNNPDVRIELPGKLGKAAKLMKQFGMGAQVDQLEASMNRAAEVAVPQAQGLLVEAVKKMTVADAKGISRAVTTLPPNTWTSPAANSCARSSCRSSSRPPTRSAWSSSTTPSPARRRPLGWSMRRAPTSRAMSPSRPSTGSSR